MPPMVDFQRRDLPVRGIALTILAILILGVQDALAKILVQDYSPFQIVMMRYWALAAFSLVLVARQAPLRQALRTRVPLWQLLMFEAFMRQVVEGASSAEVPVEAALA